MGEVELRLIGPSAFVFNRPYKVSKVNFRMRIYKVAEWIRIVIGNYASFSLGRQGASEKRIYSLTPHSVFSRYEWKWKPRNVIEGVSLDKKWSCEPIRIEDAITILYDGWNSDLKFIANTNERDAQKEATVLNRSATAGQIVLEAYIKMDSSN